MELITMDEWEQGEVINYDTKFETLLAGINNQIHKRSVAKTSYYYISVTLHHWPTEKEMRDLGEKIIKAGWKSYRISISSEGLIILQLITSFWFSK